MKVASQEAILSSVKFYKQRTSWSFKRRHIFLVINSNYKVLCFSGISPASYKKTVCVLKRNRNCLAIVIRSNLINSFIKNCLNKNNNCNKKRNAGKEGFFRNNKKSFCCFYIAGNKTFQQKETNREHFISVI